MTAGMRTTEFWVVVAFGLAGVACVVWGGIIGRDALVFAGAAQQTVAATAYVLGRSKTKGPRPYLPPSGKL